MLVTLDLALVNILLSCIWEHLRTPQRSREATAGYIWANEGSQPWKDLNLTIPAQIVKPYNLDIVGINTMQWSDIVMKSLTFCWTVTSLDVIDKYTTSIQIFPLQIHRMAKSLLKHVSLLQNCVSMSYGSMCLVSMCLISRKYLSSCPYWGLPTSTNINVKYSAMLTANICLEQLIGCDCIWYDWEHINYDYNQGDQTKCLTPVQCEEESDQ